MSFAVLLLYYGSLLTLAFFSLHRLFLLWLLRAQPRNATTLSNDPHRPFVTVLLPIFNERFVVARVLGAIGRLRYPRNCLELLVLDDSTDDTIARINTELDTLRADGWTVHHIRRTSRDGFKAGALAVGTQRARGEFLLLLDADFVPQPDLIERLLAPFATPRVAMVQARWGHLNESANRLTRVQALLLDAHFLLETDARARADLFFNFHGTAGLWRKAAIVDAGGWTADTLTEDLDLSYRAQLSGWKFAFLPNVVVPAELPDTLASFKQQQARWAEGTIATARKLLPRVYAAPLPPRIKIEATIHLLAHLVYPAALVASLLALPAILLRRELGLAWLGWAELLLALSIVIPNRVFFRRAARLAGRRPPGLRDLPVLLLTGMALAVSNSGAVLRGLLGANTEFVRTPKSAGIQEPRLLYRSLPTGSQRFVEGFLALYLICGLAVVISIGMSGAAPAFAMLAYAFGSTAARG